MRGVNLGNWLVLEKWMAPDLFSGTDAEDETELCRQLDALGAGVKRERFATHRDSWITEEDFAWLAGAGVELLRLPVPWFVFGDQGLGTDLYVACGDHVDRAVGWAEAHGLQVLLDLHTVPDSQNGFDNGGMSGVCKWHRSPQYVEVALRVLEQLAARYAGSSALWGLEVLNEPVSPELWDALEVQRRYPPADPAYAAGSEGVPTAVLRDYYTRAHERVRAVAPDLRLVFHDGFRPAEWHDVLRAPAFTDVVLDTHQYHMTYGLWPRHRDRAVATQDDYLDYVRDGMGAVVRAAAEHVPVMVGEWSVDTASPLVPQDPEARRAYYRVQAEAQAAAWRPAVAWTYWAYKVADGVPAADVWGLRQAVEAGIFPADLRALG